ncbi:MAG: PQQ-binding-like beta-propeller repeat protein, partial [Thermogutta sp.]
SFSPVGEKFAGGAYIEPLRDYWDHRLERAFAPGTDWPQQHGPTLTGSAVDCRQELVDDISQARLVWIADLPIPGGRGGIPRSPFGFFPINNSGLGATQYSAPIVANGKVYLALPYVDEKLLASSDKVSDHPQVIRGMDPRALAHELKLFRDSLICFDAQTGRTLWMFQDPRHSELLGHSKSGRGLTAVYHNGKVIFRGQHALYAVDAETGKLLWQNDGVKAPKGDDSSYNFAESQAWSTDHSPVLIDGVLVVRINDTPSGPRNQQATQAKHTSLLGLDPESGRLLWRARNVTGENAIAIPVVLGGKTYIVAAYNGDVAVAERLQTARPEEIGMLSLIDPKTGQIVWQEPVVGPNPLYPLVWNDIVALNVERERIQQGPKGKKEVDSTLGAFRLSVTGPEPLWRAAGVDYPSGRTTPIVHHGVLLVDSRETGFQAIDAASGKVLGKFPHIYELAGGSHNWTWIVASNGRAFVSSGDRLLMFRVDNGRFEKMPGELQVDLASGYICPIRPALADGRLFVRTGDGLACYDLRKPMNQ